MNKENIWIHEFFKKISRNINAIYFPYFILLIYQIASRYSCLISEGN